MLIKFWPLIVFAIFTLVLFRVKGKKSKFAMDFDEAKKWDSRFWSISFVSFVVLAVFCLFWLGMSSESNVGDEYVAPRYEDGKIIKGHMISGESNVE